MRWHTSGQQLCRGAICTDDGSVYGTLCGASTERVPQPPENIELMKLFARVIGHLISSLATAHVVR